MNTRTILRAAAIAMLPLMLAAQPAPKVKTGLDVLRASDFDLLRGKKLGIVTNATGVTADLKHIVDVLHGTKGIEIVALFGPEHGVRGDIPGGEKVDSYIDEQTKLQVYSLYGRTSKPTAEMLKGIDLLVYDIQDIGCRSYTYISTMGRVMEAAAENNIPLLVLDRPNPLGGDRVEGPVLDMKLKSFIGFYQIPYVYGLTPGELAQMINGEGWLPNNLKCSLQVVKCSGLTRAMTWNDTGLEWVPTSPHIPHAITSFHYVITGTFGELQTVNHGVGYTLPFELVGTPYANASQLAADLNARSMPGVIFRPLSYKPFYFDTAKVFQKGVQIHITDPAKVDLTLIQISIQDALLKLYPDNNFITAATEGRKMAYDRANGTTMIREELLKRTPVAEIMKKIAESNAPFKKMRKQYLLY